MNKIKRNGLFLAACFAFQAVTATAQITTLAQIQSNAEINAQISLSNTQARAEYHRLHPTKAESEWLSKMVNYANSHPSKAWPEASKKQDTLQHCAEVLQSAIDANQIEKACSKMTNQPEAVIDLQNLTKVAMFNINEFAILLTNPELDTFIGQAGCSARISNSTNSLRFHFWSENGPVKYFEKRTADGGHVLVRAEFDKNGKLFAFNLNELDSKGVPKTKMQLVFNEDGTLRSHWMRPAGKKP